MPNIEYMNGIDLSNVIVIYSDAVEGTAASTAIATLGASGYPTNGAGSIVSFPMQKLTGGGTASVEAVYAAQMWDYWKIRAGAELTTLGAAAATVKSWASGVLIGDSSLAGTLAGTGGLLTISVPTAVAAITPILGAGLGYSLYESNPELWTKISQAVLPWAYEGKDVVGAVVDANGQVYLPKDMVTALKELYDQEIKKEWVSPVVPEGVVVSPITSCSYLRGDDNQEMVVYSGRAGDIMFNRLLNDGASMHIGIYSTSPNVEFITDVYKISTGERTYHNVEVSTHTTPAYIHDGRGVYQYWKSIGSSIGTFSSLVPISSYYYTDPQGSEAGMQKSAWTAFYGTEHTDYPEGLSPWGGQSVNIDTTPTIDVVTNPETGATSPYFPVTLPIGDPIISNDPQIEPDPIAPVELPKLDPYIAPALPDEMFPLFPDVIEIPAPVKKVAPQTKIDPIYVPLPDLDPLIDPSLPIDIDISDQLPTEVEPESTGSTPPIIFPPVDIPFPSIVPASGSGLIHVYNPTPEEFIAFGHWLWVTYADTSITKLWNNPFDGIIGAHELYATPSDDGSDTIKSGFLDSGIESTLVRNRYTSINCGSIVIPEYYGNYLDYSPYSKAYAYLPFIGIVEVDVDDIVGHAINILYHVDAYNGSCIAQITVAKEGYENTVYQFSGNCAVDLPLAGGSQSAIRAGLISAAASGIGSTINGIINGAAFGGLGGALVGGLTGLVGGVSSGVANVVSQKSSVQHSGSFGASYGAMGIKTPYIIIRRPIQKPVENYQTDYGFPAHKRVLIGACRGFLRVKEVNVQSTLATDEEKAKIEELLKTGVYVS